MRSEWKIRRYVLTGAVAAIVGSTLSARAELIYGLARTGNGSLNNLITFDSATPGTVNVLGNITGLGNLQYLDDIDFRPATGELYGLGYTGSVYKININTLVATSVGSVPAPGSGFAGGAIDFNPVSDRLRLIDGQSGFNFAFNPDTGTKTLDSMSAQYVAGDPNVGQTPRVSAIAYNNNVNGALTTTLYGIDIRQPQVNPPTSILSTITPPGSGNLTTVGNTGVGSFDAAGFDISGATGIAYAGLRQQNQPTVANFYTVDLNTGAASFVGVVGIDSTQYILAGITVAPTALPPGGGGNGVPVPPAAFIGSLGAAMAGGWARRMRKGR